MTDSKLPLAEALDEIASFLESMMSGHTEDVSQAAALLRQLYAIAVECREACLFDDDDGTIGVTEDAIIPSGLFDRINAAIAAAEGEQS